MTVVKEEVQNGIAGGSEEQQRQSTREQRDCITEAHILERAAHLFRPSRFQVKRDNGSLVGGFSHLPRALPSISRREIRFPTQQCFSRAMPVILTRHDKARHE